MVAGLTASHRGGSGSPMVLLHGFTGSWRVWDLVLGELDEVGHCPQLDVPLETAQLILGFTGRLRNVRHGRTAPVTAARRRSCERRRADPPMHSSLRWRLGWSYRWSEGRFGGPDAGAHT